MKRILTTLTLLAALALAPMTSQPDDSQASDLDSFDCVNTITYIDPSTLLKQVEEKAEREGWIDESKERD